MIQFTTYKLDLNLRARLISKSWCLPRKIKVFLVHFHLEKMTRGLNLIQKMYKMIYFCKINLIIRTNFKQNVISMWFNYFSVLVFLNSYNLSKKCCYFELAFKGQLETFPEYLRFIVHIFYKSFHRSCAESFIFKSILHHLAFYFDEIHLIELNVPRYCSCKIKVTCNVKHEQ